MKINNETNVKNIDWICKTGLLAVLILPVLVIPIWFYPVDWGKTILFRSIFSIILFLLFYNLFFKKGYKFLDFLKASSLKRNTVFWLLSALAVLSLLATVFSKDVLFSFLGSPYRGSGSLNFVFYIIFSITVFFMFKESDWQKAWKLSIFIGILVALIAVFQDYGMFKSIFIPFEGRPPSMIGGAMFLGTYLLLLLFITLSLFIKEKNRGTKIFYGVAVALFLWVILLTGSRAAYVGLLAGSFYFFFFYSTNLVSSEKKRLVLISKVLALAVLFVAVCGVLYVNYANKESPVLISLEKNKTIREVFARLPIDAVMKDPRFSAWQVGLKGLEEKPLLGWGPDNFSIAFDKYYDPSLPYISRDWGGWWDRAHNVLLEIAVTTGVPAMLAYLAIFIVLFWQLQKNKNKEGRPEGYPGHPKEDQIMFHGIQATLIAYLADNFFTFDTFSSYIIFFLLIAYCLHLINKNQPVTEDMQTKKAGNNLGRKAILAIMFCILLLFLWKYNIKPFLINVEINKAEELVAEKECPDAFKKMDNVILQHSFLDSYSRLQYTGFIKKCAENDPRNYVFYAQKGTELLKEAVKIQPLYTRSWIFLGGFETVLANLESDQNKKNEWLSEASSCLKKAVELSPKHIEIIAELAKLDIVKQDYQDLKEKAKECILLDPSLGDCYWLRALSEIYLKDYDAAELDMKTARNGIFNPDSVSSLYQLANAYAGAENYEKLAVIYERLLEIDSSIPEFHSSLAFTYFKLGDYKKARYEALMFLRLMPEAKDEVDAFLKMLPY